MITLCGFRHGVSRRSPSSQLLCRVTSSPVPEPIPMPGPRAGDAWRSPDHVSVHCTALHAVGKGGHLLATASQPAARRRMRAHGLSTASRAFSRLVSCRVVSCLLVGRGLLRVGGRGRSAVRSASPSACSVAQLADGGGPAAAASAPAARRLLVVQRVAARPLPQPLEEAALLPRALAHVFWNIGKKGWISDNRKEDG